MMSNTNGFNDWNNYMSTKIKKLEQQFTLVSEPFRETNLFQNISIYVNGLTNPSADELKRIMMKNGGTYHHYECKNTTYVIASCLADAKIRNMDTSKLITAQWVVDCLKNKKILDYRNYLLFSNKTPHPKLFFENNEGLQLTNVRQKMSPNFKNENNLKYPKIINSYFCKISKPKAKSANDPDFLYEFYNNSRLHHIATLRSGFKRYISELREKNFNEIFPAREMLKNKLPTNLNTDKFFNSIIMHIDMDCFFVSVGLRTHKHLLGQPIAVTHWKEGPKVTARSKVDHHQELKIYTERLETKLYTNIKIDRIKKGFESNDSLSEIASCSYEARQMGVRNGMFVGQALKLCPELKTIPYDFEAYKEVAFLLYNTIAQYTLNIEAVSCDEMFVDLTDLIRDIHVQPKDFISFLRNEIRTKTKCTCSSGVGANRLQARMATKEAKPDGQFFLGPETDTIVEYMSKILLCDLPGVGHNTTYILKEQNWKTCGDLQKIPLVKLQMKLGKKMGEILHHYCRGSDIRPLKYEQIRKSVSAEVNYGIRFFNFQELKQFLKQLCSEVHSRLIETKRKCKNVTLKLMIRSKDAPLESAKFLGHGACTQISKSISFLEYTDDMEKICNAVLTIVRSLKIPPNEFRGIGIQISKLNEVKKKKENVIKNMFEEAFNSKIIKSICDSSEKMLNHEDTNSSAIRTKQIDRNHILLSMPHNALSNIRLKKIDIDVFEKPPVEEASPWPRLNIEEKKVDQIDKNSIPKTIKENSSIDTNRNIEIYSNGKKIETKKKICDNNIFKHENPFKLIKNWVNSTDSPEKLDIKLLSQHFCEFIKIRRIHDVYMPIVNFHRIVDEKKSCKWHIAFKSIILDIQKEMIINFESKMFLQENLSCENCKI